MLTKKVDDGDFILFRFKNVYMIVFDFVKAGIKLEEYNSFRRIRVIKTVRKFLNIPLTPFFSGRESHQNHPQNSNRRSIKILWFLLLFLWSTPSLSLSYFINEKHYKGMISYQIIDYMEMRSAEIKKTVEKQIGKPLDTKAFQEFFFVQSSEGLKIKGGGENRARLIYIYLDQWLMLGEGYISNFDEIHLTKEDLNKIKVLFSASELHIVESLISLWKTRYHPVQAFHSFLWDLSKIRESKHQEFEFLWAFLMIEAQVVSHFFPGRVDPDLLPEMANNPSSIFRKARSMVRKFAKKGFVPAQHLEGFMNMIFYRDLNAALIQIEQSYHNDYRKETGSVLLGVFYRKLYPNRPGKVEAYLKEAIYTHAYRTHNYLSLKGELLEWYIETGRSDAAFQIAREIAENFTDFSIHTFLQSMEWLSQYFYNKDNGDIRNLKESYTWMEVARIAAEDHYGDERHFSSSQSRAISLRAGLTSKQIRQLKRKAADLYEARKYLLTAGSSQSCTPSLFH